MSLFTFFFFVLWLRLGLGASRLRYPHLTFISKVSICKHLPIMDSATTEVDDDSDSVFIRTVALKIPENFEHRHLPAQNLSVAEFLSYKLPRYRALHGGQKELTAALKLWKKRSNVDSLAEDYAEIKIYDSEVT